jgi:hypothetical protein
VTDEGTRTHADGAFPLNSTQEPTAGSGQETITPDRWGELITAAMANRPVPITAKTYRNKKWSSRNNPVLLVCGDGGEYVVKGAHYPRDVINDQIVGRLARVIGAPVPEMRLIDVPAELIAANPDMRHIPAGLAHGSQSLYPDCTERLNLEAHLLRLPANRSRLALLAVLYGWVKAGDHQFLYRKSRPELVYSVDHGHFFPGGPEWTLEGLQAVGRAQPDEAIMGAGSLTRDEIAAALRMLSPVRPESIAEAVAGPPEAWHFPLAFRVAAAQYLYKRQGELLNHESLRS